MLADKAVAFAQAPLFCAGLLRPGGDGIPSRNCLRQRGMFVASPFCSVKRGFCPVFEGLASAAVMRMY